MPEGNPRAVIAIAASFALTMGACAGGPTAAEEMIERYQTLAPSPDVAALFQASVASMGAQPQTWGLRIVLPTSDELNALARPAVPHDYSGALRFLCDEGCATNLRQELGRAFHEALGDFPSPTFGPAVTFAPGPPAGTEPVVIDARLGCTLPPPGTPARDLSPELREILCAWQIEARHVATGVAVRRAVPIAPNDPASPARTGTDLTELMGPAPHALGQGLHDLFLPPEPHP